MEATKLVLTRLSVRITFKRPAFGSNSTNKLILPRQRAVAYPHSRLIGRNGRSTAARAARLRLFVSFCAPVVDVGCNPTIGNQLYGGNAQKTWA